MKKVLIIEDEKDFHRILKRQFDLLLKGEKICLFFATSIEEAVEMFKLHQNDLSVISFDGCIAGGGTEPNTKILAEVFRKSFKGPMIAVSGQPAFRKILMEAGCSHQCPKDVLAEEITKILLGLG